MASFGKFVKFYVKENVAPDFISGRPDAFAILMRSSCEQSACKTLPSRATVNKDELFNAIITLFEKVELKWNPLKVERGTVVRRWSLLQAS